jgi:hypothetical protein
MEAYTSETMTGNQAKVAMDLLVAKLKVTETCIMGAHKRLVESSHQMMLNAQMVEHFTSYEAYQTENIDKMQISNSGFVAGSAKCYEEQAREFTRLIEERRWLKHVIENIEAAAHY